MTTDNDKLKKLLKELPVPEPSPESRDKAVRAAMAEFNRRKAADKKNIKGFSFWGRLKDKTPKGGPMMTKK